MIIGITGRIAAGKETLTEFLRENGFEYFKTSEILAMELEKRGLEINRKNMQDLGDSWRKEHGPGALMKMILDKIDMNQNLIIDSLRNAKEAEFLREELGGNFILVGVDAPRKIRFDRIVKRGKKSDLRVWENFLEIDERDNFDPKNPLGQQVGKCIETADFVIMNDKDLDHTLNQIKDIYKKLKC
jgi:dephospho-CoA kinase|tara:strand:+ start:2884 stop:3441 length:558 start_codon:yes stop_codon:yes gene_type:complete